MQVVLDAHRSCALRDHDPVCLLPTTIDLHSVHSSILGPRRVSYGGTGVGREPCSPKGRGSRRPWVSWPVLSYNPHLGLECLSMVRATPDAPPSPGQAAVRLGLAAEMLGVSVETLRRWETEGRIAVERTTGGRRRVPLAEVARLLAERRRTVRERPIAARSARNRFPGIVTRVEADRVAAVVEVQAGPHRLVSLMTAEAAAELHLRVGDEVVCSVKATNVVVEVPAGRGHRPSA